MDIATLIRIAKSTAIAHGLAPELVCAVCEHESSWDPWAVRFEPAFEERYIKPMIAKLPATEAMLRAVSFGLMQLMGETARELGFAGKFVTELCDPLAGLEFGCRKLANCMKLANSDIRAALLKYNGGGDPNYPDLVMPLIGKYKAAA